jgi:murein L,D-transpeptidase YcbB/YkuD
MSPGWGWMSEHYVRLRALTGRARNSGASAPVLDRLALNLDRARLLPGPAVRHIVVDASSGRLWYYQAGKQVGTMRVVVGAPETQTPMLAGMLQWAVLNPYWNVPDYLVRDDVAPKVLRGARSLP